MQLEVTLIVNVISTDPFRGLFALKQLNKFEGRKAKRGRGREERQTERQRDRQTRQTDTEGDRQRETETQRQADRVPSLYKKVRAEV